MADQQAMFWKIQRGELPYPPAAQALGCHISEVDPDAGTIVVEFAPTLNLNVPFHAPASPGRITGTARVVHRGGRVFSAAGELRQDGRLLATGQATAVVVKSGP